MWCSEDDFLKDKSEDDFLKTQCCGKSESQFIFVTLICSESSEVKMFLVPDGAKVQDFILEARSAYRITVGERFALYDWHTNEEIDRCDIFRNAVRNNQKLKLVNMCRNSAQ